MTEPCWRFASPGPVDFYTPLVTVGCANRGVFANVFGSEEFFECFVHLSVKHLVVTSEALEDEFGQVVEF